MKKEYKLYQLLCENEQEREDLKIAVMEIKNYSKEKTNAKALIEIAEKIKNM